MKRIPCEKHNTITILAGVFSGVGCLLMVTFPRLALSAADRGLSLFLKSVLPSLLPFFICANFMIALGVPAVLGRFFEMFFRKLFHAPGSSAFAFIISITSGYPMGAKLIGDMGRRGEISVSEGRRMLAFCTTSGPLFMLGTVGAGMLKSSRAGAVIALSHYAAALLNGLLFRVFLDLDERRVGTGFRVQSPQAALLSRRGAGGGSDGSKTGSARAAGKQQGGLLELFTTSILSAFQSLGIICGYIVLFTLLTDFLEHSGALAFACDWQRGIAKGILEMTVGAQTIAAGDEISLTLKCALCSMLISFGGISITAQSISMLEDFPVGMGYYIKTKLCHGFIAFFTALALGSRLLDSAAAAGAFPVSSPENILGGAYGTVFSVKMTVLVVTLFLATCILQNIADSLKKAGKRRRKAREARQEQRAKEKAKQTEAKARQKQERTERKQKAKQNKTEKTKDKKKKRQKDKKNDTKSESTGDYCRV